MTSPNPEMPTAQLPQLDLPAASAASAEQLLRGLALLEIQQRELIDRLRQQQLTAAESLTYFKLADTHRRTSRVSLVHAAGAVSATTAHRLAQNSLDQVFALTPEQIASGAPLAVNQLLPASTKAHYRSEADVLAQLGDCKPQAAKVLLTAYRHLVGSPTQPPLYATLGKLFHDPGINPEIISQAAARISGLQLRGPARRRAEELVATSSAQGQSAVNAELKSLADELSTPDLPERENVHERCSGLRYRGLGPRGHIWELTCTTLVHEFLSTWADRLVNPNLSANRRGSAFFQNDNSEQESPGQAEAELSDPASVKARKLLEAIIEILRRQTSPRRATPTNLVDETAPSDDHPATELAAPSSPGEAISAEGQDSLTLPPMIDLLVTIDYDALLAKTTQAGITSHGQRISATELRQSAAIAGIIPVVLGSEGEILDYGRRRRLFSAAQTRAVVGRDRGCINPGCTMPAHRCEVNHCRPWHRGGKTSVDNGCLLCKHCHTAFHAGHFRIKMVNAVPYVQQSRERDPQRLWRRNWVWHPQAEALAA
ncbi:HNH endonuclease [Glutamicibacter uratoxydans]|uniref:HNH endonuclease n=1 Tax=Glutamicibacter uratoxydans TaxID=43667 RepID=UPI003D700FC8